MVEQKTLYEHSLKLGFDESSARSVEKRMQELIFKYDRRDLAQGTFNEGYAEYVANMFSDSQLRAFLREVENKSFRADNHELFEKLGESDISIRYAQERGASEARARAYFTRREQYLRETKPKRELEALKELEKGEYWNILNNKVWRNIQRIEMPRAHLISTPTGGFQGYKRNFRRR